MRRHLLPPGGDVLASPLSDRMGDVMEGCKMTAVHHRSGALMELPDRTVAFVHVSISHALVQQAASLKEFVPL